MRRLWCTAETHRFIMLCQRPTLRSICKDTTYQSRVKSYLRGSKDISVSHVFSKIASPKVASYTHRVYHLVFNSPLAVYCWKDFRAMLDLPVQCQNSMLYVQTGLITTFSVNRIRFLEISFYIMPVIKVVLPFASKYGVVFCDVFLFI